MRLNALLFGLAWADGSLALLQGRDASPKIANSTAPSSKRYIVEFSKGTNQQEAISQISARPGSKIVKIFNSTIFSGVSIESHTDNLDTLRIAGTHIANVWTSNLLQLDPDLKAWPLSSFGGNATAGNWSTHSLTGVDKLHSAGVLGKGARVAVIDTGIQYTHPALGGGFGPGFKVAGGYDLVGNGNYPFEGEKTPDNDPMDQLGHGTHVAGIIAGKSEFMTGVAPDATLLAFKVMGGLDGVLEDDLVEAFLMARDADEVDIITASIGGTDGWSENAWADIASRIVEEGILVTIAAGNNGVSGPFIASSGSSGKNVIAVAATDPSMLPAIPWTTKFAYPDGSIEEVESAYRPAFLMDIWAEDLSDWPIYPLSLDLSDDQWCTPQANPPNLTNKVALIRRSTACASWEQGNNMYAAGIKYALWYNNDQVWQDPDAGNPFAQRGMIERQAGEAIVAAVKAGVNVTGTFTKQFEQFKGMPNPAAGRPTYYTTWGGLYELELKPDIAAPGSYIVSTYPTDDYAMLSGTSMATPYVAGVAALYIGKYGGKKVHGPNFAKDLAQRIISSGTATPWSDGYLLDDHGGYSAPAIQVGNGLINAVKVLESTISLSVEGYKFILNDTHHFSRYHSVDVTNNADQPVTYTFSLKNPVGTELFKPWDASNPYDSGSFYGIPELVPIGLVPSVKMPSGTFTVQPGQTKKAEFIFSIPDGGNENAFPVYSGQIIVSGSNGDELSIPYFGVKADIKKLFDDIFYSHSDWPYMLSGNEIPLANHSSFTFNLSLDSQDFPRLHVAFSFGAKELRWDIYEANWSNRKWSYPPVVGVDGYIGSVAYWRYSPNYAVFDPSFDDASDLVNFPATFFYRGQGYRYAWLGDMADGSKIAPGKYTMRIAALKPFGDPTHADNWDIWDTPQIEVLPL
ncbi:subtilase [Thozetella sp. PMI_491]|nr:subtilase [Thozetella sp. PMI_491]